MTRASRWLCRNFPYNRPTEVLCRNFPHRFCKKAETKPFSLCLSVYMEKVNLDTR
jgi:hypothetical protein